MPVWAGLGSYGGMERLHYLLERVWERPDEELSIHFLKVRQTAAQAPASCNPSCALAAEGRPKHDGCQDRTLHT